ncbi:MAG: hypothetical protein ACKPDM_17090, partial [Dolichospermum sp.]
MFALAVSVLLDKQKVGKYPTSDRQNTSLIPPRNRGFFIGKYKNKMPIISNLLSLSPDSPIELFEVSGYNLTELSETLYICNYTGVSFEGQEYAAIGCESEGWDLVGQGPIPTPQLTVSNIGR